MKDIEIRCPNEVHKRPVRRVVDGVEEEYVPKPKLLLIASAESIGRFKIQCTGATPKAHGKCWGWHEIRLNGTGGVSVKPLRKQYFPLNHVPVVVEDME